MDGKYDEIFQMLDWNNSSEIQNKGIELGLNVEDFSIFIMPESEKYNFNVWENCAEIIYRKTDKQIKPYLFDLFRWFEDMNWPGALIIVKRLEMYKNRKELEEIRRKSLNLAKQENKTNWEMFLKTYKSYLDTDYYFKKYDIKFNDTFALKINNELYPEYNGKYLILNFIENKLNKDSERLLVRIKMTDSYNNHITIDELNSMEYVKIAMKWFEERFSIYDYENKTRKNNITFFPNEYGMLFEYQLEIVNTNDVDQLLDQLIYLGNFELTPPEDELIPLDDGYFTFSFPNSIFDIVLDSYYSYNEKQNKTIFDKSFAIKQNYLYLNKLKAAIDLKNNNSLDDNKIADFIDSCNLNDFDKTEDFIKYKTNFDQALKNAREKAN